MKYTAEEIQAAGLDDFRVFLRQVWDFLGLPKPTRVQNDMARYLQHGPDRLVIQAFRGVGKSWITVAFVLWILLLDPDKKILVVSAGQKLSDDFSKFAKQLIHAMPMLQHLAPRFDQRDSAISFDVGPARPSRDPSVKSAGITGQITGSRADVIIGDDVEIPKNSMTHLMRERLAEQVKEFDDIVKPDGRIVFLGTPQVESSLYRRLPKRGYRIRVWPAEIPEKVSQFGGTLAPLVVKMAQTTAAGTPTDPARFDQEVLMSKRLSHGTARYQLQYMLDTTPASAEKYPLKLRDLIVMDVDQDLGHVKVVWGQDRTLNIQDLMCGGLDTDVYNAPAWRSDEMVKWTGTVMAIDPSGRGKDETAYAVVRSHHGMLYLVASGGFVEGFSQETLTELANICARFKVTDVISERNYGGGMFESLFQPYLRKVSSAKIDTENSPWHSTQKETRIIDCLLPLLSDHRLVVDRRVIDSDIGVQQDTERYSLAYQLTRIHREKGALANEDRLEALSMACAYFVERLSRDRDKTLEKHKGDQIDAELRKFMDHVVTLGRRPHHTGHPRLR